VLRILVGAVLLVQSYVLWKYRSILLDPEGPLPWAISDTWLDPLLPKLSHVVSILGGAGMPAEAAVATVLAVHALASAFFLVGYRTRTSTIVAWATFVVIKNSSFPYMYGVGAMLLIALFYSLFMPVGREWSVDRALKPAAVHPPGDASYCVLMFRLHLCIIYAASAFSKAVGEQWWSGDAIWRALSLPQFAQFDPQPLLAAPWLLVAGSFVTIVCQLLYPVLVWTRLRVPIVILAELMHLGIAIFLGLWLFSGMMIALNTAAFGQALWRALASPATRREATAPRGKLQIVYDGACPFCDDYVRYQRLQAAAASVELVDARSHPEVLAEHAISHAHLEDGMVVIVDGVQHHGADAVHVLSTLSEPPGKGWVRAVAALGHSRPVARIAYPFMKVGRRIALAILGVPRFPRG
jgi:predicted DCC family thiol-disulfide oxidoreductase YuxK